MEKNQNYMSYPNVCRLLRESQHEREARKKQEKRWLSQYGIERIEKLFLVNDVEKIKELVKDKPMIEVKKQPAIRKERAQRRPEDDDSVLVQVDKETGEVIETCPTAVVLREGDRVIRKEQIEYLKKNDRSQEQTSVDVQNNSIDEREFVWLFYEDGAELFPDVSLANITRLMYLSTFKGWEETQFTKKALSEILKLEHTEFYEFLDQVTNAGILIPKTDQFGQETLILNPKIFQKGKLYRKKNLQVTRLFCEFIQNMYQQCQDSSMHKQIGYIFKLIPFVHRGSNVVVKPSGDKEKTFVPVKLGEFCGLVGYNKKNARRLAKDLLNITVDGRQLINFLVPNISESEWIILINPSLFYGGAPNQLFYDIKTYFLQNYQKDSLQKSGEKGGLIDFIRDISTSEGAE